MATVQIPVAPRISAAKTPRDLEGEIDRLRSLVLLRKSEGADEVVRSAYLATARKYLELARQTNQIDYGWAALQFYDKAANLGVDIERERMTAIWEYSCGKEQRFCDEILTEEDVDW